MKTTPEVLLDGLVFPEGPRWRDDRLWLADMHAHRVLTVDMSGSSETIAELPDKPSGIGFLKNGTPIVVSMRRKLIIQLGPDHSLTTYADLYGLPGSTLNDMVTDGLERSYVGLRIDRGVTRESLEPKDPRSPEGIVLVLPGGSTRIVADNLFAPNGTVVSPDLRTLIVAEARGHRLVKFDIEEDGSLSNRRLFAETGDAFPDGIALDAEGAVWIGGALGGMYRRVLEGGRVTHEIKLPAGQSATACAIGGPDRQTLFMIVAETTLENLNNCRDFESDLRSTSRGWVQVADLEVPGAGWP